MSVCLSVCLSPAKTFNSYIMPAISDIPGLSLTLKCGCASIYEYLYRLLYVGTRLLLKTERFECVTWYILVQFGTTTPQLQRYQQNCNLEMNSIVCRTSYSLFPYYCIYVTLSLPLPPTSLSLFPSVLASLSPRAKTAGNREKKRQQKAVQSN